jgi:hypothetical protein
MEPMNDELNLVKELSEVEKLTFDLMNDNK